MCVLLVIAVLVGAIFIFLLAITDFARELSRHSFQSPPDLDSSGDWDVASDEIDGTPGSHSRAVMFE